ncbi:MAG: DUF3810 domain-containing protein [Flavicella sp.]
MNNFLYARYLSLILLIQIGLVQIASFYPKFIENYYATGIYPHLSQALRLLQGWLPFSIGDIIYIVMLFYVLRFFYIVIRDKFSELLKYLYAIGASISLLYFFFHLLWGLNYYRIPLTETLSIKTKTYNIAQLNNFTVGKINDLNKLHLTLTANDSLAVKTNMSRIEIQKRAIEGYQNLSRKHSFLVYKKPSVKKSILSTPLSYMGFAGYLNPFTGEAQVNSKIPMCTYPFTVAHEVAHQLGYAAEDEANFIGYLSCMAHDDPYFKYAGQLTAVKYLLSDIYRNDKKNYLKTRNLLNKGILKNITESRVFWDAYKNPLEPLFKKSYNSFLKVNHQKEGIKSYNAMVNLMINYST